MFGSMLVANRGEIARRIIRTARRMGVQTVAVYSEADGNMPFVREADQAVLLGPAPPAHSYMDVEAIMHAAMRMGAEAVHPGYGFLAESAEFARRVEKAGLIWVGPAPETIEEMGDKINARNRMAREGISVAEGSSDPVPDVEAALREAERIRYPVMVKAAAGGGGIGMSVARSEAELRQAYETARTRAERFFGSRSILLEKYIEHARHVEIQILGLADGRIVALGERDCSVQRRHQKVVEETPSPGVGEELRARMCAAAVSAGSQIDFRGAGTVECLVSPADQEFVFLEMNTRLQVEHPITELVTGIDLVEQQLLIAAGEAPSFDPDSVRPYGHAMEFRIYAEDPKRFLPSPGDITEWEEPAGEGVRVDAGYGAGNTVSPFYDPLLAKLCVSAEDRSSCLSRARTAVEAFHVTGPKTNLPFLSELLDNREFRAGDYDTGLISRMRTKGVS